jgi:flagellar hook-length control protein FliK
MPANPGGPVNKTPSNTAAPSGISGFNLLLDSMLGDALPSSFDVTGILPTSDAPPVPSGTLSSAKKAAATAETDDLSEVPAAASQIALSAASVNDAQDTTAWTALPPHTLQTSGQVSAVSSDIVFGESLVEKPEKPPPRPAEVGTPPVTSNQDRSFDKVLTVDAASKTTGGLIAHRADLHSSEPESSDSIARLGISKLTYTRQPGSGYLTSQSSTVITGQPTDIPVVPSTLSVKPSGDVRTSSAAEGIDQPQRVNPADSNPDAINKAASHSRVPISGLASAPASGQPMSAPAAELVAAIPADNARTGERLAAPTRMTTASSGSQISANTATDSTALGEGHDAAGRERQPSPEAAGSSILAVPSRQTGSTHITPVADPPSASLHDRVQVINQLADRLETMRLSQGRHEVMMQLKPDHLGELSLTIVAERHTVTAHITADTPYVRQVVEDGREQLRTALEQKGFTLQGFDVALNQGGAERRFAFAAPVMAPLTTRPLSASAIEVEQQSYPVLVPQRIYRLDGRLDYQA